MKSPEWVTTIERAALQKVFLLPVILNHIEEERGEKK